MMLGLALVATSAARSESGQTSARDWTRVDTGSGSTVGGPFSLVNHDGNRVTDRDFRGRFLLLYFGYTYCPDLCPTGLQVIGEAIDLLGAAGRHIQPIFVSIDPDRDGIEHLADYVEAFHPRLVGLTGTSRQVAEAAKVFGVRYGKIYFPWSNSDGDAKDGDQGANDEYAMYHTTFTFLVGPEGTRLATFPRGIWPDALAREIRRQMAAYGR